MTKRAKLRHRIAPKGRLMWLAGMAPAPGGALPGKDSLSEAAERYDQIVAATTPRIRARG